MKPLPAVAALLACALLAACGTPQPEHYHSLLATQPEAPDTRKAMPPVVIDLLPFSVPPQVDQPQWLVRQSDDSMLLLEQERWAAPLRDELRSAVSERLASHWGAVDVRALASPPADARRVRVDVLRFESLPGREARIDASWAIASLLCRSAISERVDGAGAAALAAAHRRAVVRLADDIGRQLQALQHGESGSCAS
ncbi:MAG TPA: PqiC family protein [Albitalea sp.]|nr:PqiC family protein [Albitalea sp.]